MKKFVNRREMVYRARKREINLSILLFEQQPESGDKYFGHWRTKQHCGTRRVLISGFTIVQNDEMLRINQLYML